MRLALVLLHVIGIGIAPVMKVQGQSPSASKSKDDYWKTDPYSKNDPDRMAKAGYLSFGPFSWGDDHDTRGIETMFPTRRFLFVETAHFKICSQLRGYRVPSRKLEKKLLVRDLRRLRAFFPSINPNTRTLDPWLRLHLFALRIEDTFADFCKKLGVTDADFPKEGTRGVLSFATGKPGGKYMGQGPFLGMRGKFLMMMLQKDADLKRYAAKAQHRRSLSGAPSPEKFYMHEVGSMFFGTSCECAKRSLFNDHALHCHMVFNTAQTLVDCYKDFYFRLPVWCREGVAHWYLRRIDPAEHCFSGLKDRDKDQRYDPKWGVKTRRRVKHGDFLEGIKLSRFMEFNELSFRDHMASWSRVDYLLSLGDQKFARFMGVLKNPIEVPAGTFPKNEEVWAQQERALKEAYDLDFASFDAAWVKYVLAEYPRR